jgi:hypothetical protein
LAQAQLHRPVEDQREQGRVGRARREQLDERREALGLVAEVREQRGADDALAGAVAGEGGEQLLLPGLADERHELLGEPPRLVVEVVVSREVLEAAPGDLRPLLLVLGAAQREQCESGLLALWHALEDRARGPRVERGLVGQVGEPGPCRGRDRLARELRGDEHARLGRARVHLRQREQHLRVAVGRGDLGEHRVEHLGPALGSTRSSEARPYRLGVGMLLLSRALRATLARSAGGSSSRATSRNCAAKRADASSSNSGSSERAISARRSFESVADVRSSVVACEIFASGVGAAMISATRASSEGSRGAAIPKHLHQPREQRDVPAEADRQRADRAGGTHAQGRGTRAPGLDSGWAAARATRALAASASPRSQSARATAARSPRSPPASATRSPRRA